MKVFTVHLQVTENNGRIVCDLISVCKDSITAIRAVEDAITDPVVRIFAAPEKCLGFEAFWREIMDRIKLVNEDTKRYLVKQELGGKYYIIDIEQKEIME